MSRMPTWRQKILWKPQPALTRMSDLIMNESGSSIWPQHSGGWRGWNIRSPPPASGPHLLRRLLSFLLRARRILHPPETLQKEGCGEDSAATFIPDNLTLLMVRLTASPFHLGAAPPRRYLGCSPWSRAFRRMRGHVCAQHITQKQKQTGHNGRPAAP